MHNFQDQTNEEIYHCSLKKMIEYLFIVSHVKRND
jgi:hypothetical protein